VRSAIIIGPGPTLNEPLALLDLVPGLNKIYLIESYAPNMVSLQRLMRTLDPDQAAKIEIYYMSSLDARRVFAPRSIDVVYAASSISSDVLGSHDMHKVLADIEDILAPGAWGVVSCGFTGRRWDDAGDYGHSQVAPLEDYENILVRTNNARFFIDELNKTGISGGRFFLCWQKLREGEELDLSDKVEALKNRSMYYMGYNKAADYLFRANDPHVIDALLDYMEQTRQSRNISELLNIINESGRLTDPRIDVFLTGLLVHDDEIIRIRAAVVLAQRGRHIVSQTLLDFLKTLRPGQNRYDDIALALAELGNNRAVMPLIECLERELKYADFIRESRILSDGTKDIRSQPWFCRVIRLIRALGRFDDEGARAALRAAAAHENVFVRYAAQTQLEKARDGGNEIRHDKKLPYIVVKDYSSLSRFITDNVCGLIEHKPDAVILIPGCNTPLGLYRMLAARVTAGDVDISRVRFVALDSPIGLALADSRNFRMFMHANFFSYIYGNIPPDADKSDFLKEFYNAHRNLIVPYVPDGASADEANALADEFGRALERLGYADLAILGLGLARKTEDGRLIGGHIAFNEPGSLITSRARIMPLTDLSVDTKFECPSKLWDERDRAVRKSPRMAITLGIADILESRNIIIAASGTGKAQEAQYLLEGNMTEDFPATYLHTVAYKTLAVLDRSAASLLERPGERDCQDGGDEVDISARPKILACIEDPNSCGKADRAVACLERIALKNPEICSIDPQSGAPVYALSITTAHLTRKMYEKLVDRYAALTKDYFNRKKAFAPKMDFIHSLDVKRHRIHELIIRIIPFIHVAEGQLRYDLAVAIDNLQDYGLGMIAAERGARQVRIILPLSHRYLVFRTSGSSEQAAEYADLLMRAVEAGMKQRYKDKLIWNKDTWLSGHNSWVLYENFHSVLFDKGLLPEIVDIMRQVYPVLFLEARVADRIAASDYSGQEIAAVIQRQAGSCSQGFINLLKGLAREDHHVLREQADVSLRAYIRDSAERIFENQDGGALVHGEYKNSRFIIRQCEGCDRNETVRQLNEAMRRLKKVKVWGCAYSVKQSQNFLFTIEQSPDTSRPYVTLPYSCLGNIPALAWNLRREFQRMRCAVNGRKQLHYADLNYFLRLAPDDREQILAWMAAVNYNQVATFAALHKAVTRIDFTVIFKLLFEERLSAYYPHPGSLRRYTRKMLGSPNGIDISAGNLIGLILDLVYTGQEKDRIDPDKGAGLNSYLGGIRAFSRTDKKVLEREDINMGVFIAKLDDLLAEGILGLNRPEKSERRVLIHDVKFRVERLNKIMRSTRAGYKARLSNVKGVLGEVSGVHKLTFIFDDTVHIPDYVGASSGIIEVNQVYTCCKGEGKECDARTPLMIAEMKFQACLNHLYTQIMGYDRKVSVARLLTTYFRDTPVRNAAYLAENDKQGLTERVLLFVQRNPDSLDKNNTPLWYRQQWNEEGFTCPMTLAELRRFLLYDENVNHFLRTYRPRKRSRSQRNARGISGDARKRAQQELRNHLNRCFGELERLYADGDFDFYITISNPKQRVLTHENFAQADGGKDYEGAYLLIPVKAVRKHDTAWRYYIRTASPQAYSRRPSVSRTRLNQDSEYYYFTMLELKRRMSVEAERLAAKHRAGFEETVDAAHRLLYEHIHSVKQYPAVCGMATELAEDILTKFDIRVTPRTVEAPVGHRYARIVDWFTRSPFIYDPTAVQFLNMEEHPQIRVDDFEALFERWGRNPFADGGQDSGDVRRETDLLIRALKDEDARVREEAALALGLFLDEASHEPLVNAFRYDPDERVRLAAAYSLDTFLIAAFGETDQRKSFEYYTSSPKDGGEHIAEKDAPRFVIAAFALEDITQPVLKKVDSTERVREEDMGVPRDTLVSVTAPAAAFFAESPIMLASFVFGNRATVAGRIFDERGNMTLLLANVKRAEREGEGSPFEKEAQFLMNRVRARLALMDVISGNTVFPDALISDPSSDSRAFVLVDSRGIMTVDAFKAARSRGKLSIITDVEVLEKGIRLSISDLPLSGRISDAVISDISWPDIVWRIAVRSKGGSLACAVKGGTGRHSNKLLEFELNRRLALIKDFQEQAPPAHAVKDLAGGRSVFLVYRSSAPWKTALNIGRSIDRSYDEQT
ncbi:MAG: HEAT repeat domain-containing protein, partial [Candidatus Omnitrophica bacterium]|nr:HEAT repeat domain-containing protein [Candidatus Omnitrophota bacterium]